MNLFLFEEVTEKIDLKSYNTNILTNSITFNPHTLIPMASMLL